MKWDLEKAKSTANLFGYKLLASEWLGVKHKYTFLSYYGIEWESSWDNFNRGKRCPRDASIDFFINVIRPEFESRGYTVLLDPEEYTVQFQRFYYVCNLGLYYETCWNNVTRGTFYTFEKRLEGYKELKSYIKSKGGRLLQPWFEFKDVDTCVRYKCNNGHIHQISLSDAREGVWCKQCYLDKKARHMISKKGIALYDTFYPRLSAQGEHVEPIIQGELKLLGVKCKKCSKIFSPHRNNVYERLVILEGNKHRSGNSFFFCSDECKNTSVYFNDLANSKFEVQVGTFIKNFYIGNVNYNDRSLLVNPRTGKNLELDLYFPDLHKAIECNGSYWHSKPKVKLRDKIKRRLCQDSGIKLLVIDEYMWYNECYNQKNIIKHFLLQQEVGLWN